MKFTDLFGDDHLNDLKKKYNVLDPIPSEITKSYEEIVDSFTDVISQTSETFVDASIHLAKVAKDLAKAPAEYVKNSLSVTNDFLKSTVSTLVTSIPTSPAFYLKEASKLIGIDPQTDRSGRKVPKPGLVTQNLTEDEISKKEKSFNAFTGVLNNTVSNLTSQAQSLASQYGFEFSLGSDNLQPKNKYQLVNYTIKKSTVTNLTEDLAKIRVYDSKNQLINSESHFIPNFFNTVEYSVRSGENLFSASLTKPQNSLAPKFSHKNSMRNLRDLVWLPLSQPINFNHREVLPTNGLATSTNILYYGYKLKKIEEIEVSLVENSELDIQNYLTEYKRAMFPTDSSNIISAIKDVYSILTYYYYIPSPQSLNYAKGYNNNLQLVKAINFAVVPTFSLEFGTSDQSLVRSIRFLVIGEDNETPTVTQPDTTV